MEGCLSSSIKHLGHVVERRFRVLGIIRRTQARFLGLQLGLYADAFGWMTWGVVMEDEEGGSRKGDASDEER